MKEIEDIKIKLSTKVRLFDYHSLEWKWEDDTPYGGDRVIYIDNDLINYLSHEASGISFFKYLDRLVGRLSRGKCYLALSNYSGSVCIVSR